MAEIWLPVPGYEGFYDVSDHGNVRSCTRQHVTRNRYGPFMRTRRSSDIAQHTDKEGYMSVRLYRDGRGRGYRVSRLVLSAFVGLPEVGDEACHINHTPSDNSVSNLMWGSRAENETQKTSAGRRPKITRSTLSSGDVQRIRELRATTSLTLKQIGAIVGCHLSNVSLIARGTTWRTE